MRRPAYVPATPADMVAAGKSQSTEFKAGARWNVHTQQPDKSLGRNIVKAVCGFLNGEGDNDAHPLNVYMSESGAS